MTPWRGTCGTESRAKTPKVGPTIGKTSEKRAFIDAGMDAFSGVSELYDNCKHTQLSPVPATPRACFRTPLRRRGERRGLMFFICLELIRCRLARLWPDFRFFDAGIGGEWIKRSYIGSILRITTSTSDAQRVSPFRNILRHPNFSSCEN